uniref:GAGE domain-containing protein n=1 Tax=Globodera pallida TaxID=36090 RepID=A0A183BU67_GLOPA
MEDVQSTSKFVQSNVQEDSDDSDDIMFVDVPAKEKKAEEDIFFIDPPLHEQAVHPASTAMNAVLTQAQLPGENQADELALIVESCQEQEPMAQAEEPVAIAGSKTRATYKRPWINNAVDKTLPHGP